MQARRIELDPRYRNRTLFVAERADAGPQSSAYRTVFDLERARRTNYEPATLAFVESLYQLVPGCIAEYLAGGEIARLEETEVPTQEEEQIEQAVAEIREGIAGIPTEDRDAVLNSILEQHRSMIRAYRKITGNPENSGENDSSET